jgi:SAM-dependent methyltransferase
MASKRAKKGKPSVVATQEHKSVKLDLGSQSLTPDGYVPMGYDHGSDIYPLGVEEESVDVIRASHVLEHFPWGIHIHVVKDWASKLKPGGVLKVAVPNLDWIVKKYVAGDDFPIEGYLYGGQTDKWDFHCGAFDEEKLRECLALAGLIDIKAWVSEVEDCASLPVSLNLQGTKPRKVLPYRDEPFKVSAVMSVPRLGFMDNFYCSFEALSPMNIRLHRHMGAYWEACLEQSITGAIKADNPDAILTLDYDSVYHRADVEQLIKIMRERPEVDALAAVQSARHADFPLFTLPGPVNYERITHGMFADDITELNTAHFGLTLIRVSSLLKARKPWLWSQPAKDMTWHNGADGRLDADIYFWKNWRESGLKVFSANRVPIGHLELSIRWPDRNFGTVLQSPQEFRELGVRPADIWK